jgi:hypothetical protein
MLLKIFSTIDTAMKEKKIIQKQSMMKEGKTEAIASSLGLIKRHTKNKKKTGT